jgi:transposase-like protein
MGVDHRTYGAEERAKVIAAIERGAKLGKSVGATAREFGITGSIYYRWIREHARAATGDAVANRDQLRPSPRSRCSAEVQEECPGQTATARYSVPRTRKLWSPAAKEAIVAKALRSRERGASWREIGEQLGTRAENLRRWCAPEASRVSLLPVVVERDLEPVVGRESFGSSSRAPGAGFVQVSVIRDEPLVAACRPTVVSPSGYRVEGLDLAGVVAVLKALA